MELIAEQSREKYRFSQERIGFGNFATVLLATRLSDGQNFAAKVFKGESNESEVNIMKYLSSQSSVIRNMVSLVDTVIIDGKFAIIMEYLNGGDVLDRILTSQKPFSERDASRCIRNLICCLHDLHQSCHVIHRDVKTDNLVFIDTSTTSDCKLVDFGFSIKVTPAEMVEGYNDSKFVGSPAYVAPEVLRFKSYSAKSDVWSAGVTAYSLLTGVSPFGPDGAEGKVAKGLAARICRGEYESFDSDIWDGISSSAKDLIGKMLTVDPVARISTHEILEHDWINNQSFLAEYAFGTAYYDRLKRLNVRKLFRKSVNAVIAAVRVRKMQVQAQLSRSLKVESSELTQHDDGSFADDCDLHVAARPVLSGDCFQRLKTVFADAAKAYAREKWRIVNQTRSCHQFGGVDMVENSSVVSESSSSSSSVLDPVDKNQKQVIIEEPAYKRPRQESALAASDQAKCFELSDSPYAPLLHVALEKTPPLAAAEAGTGAGAGAGTGNGSASADPLLRARTTQMFQLDYNSFQHAMQSVGLDLLARPHIFRLFDTNNDQKVDYREFLAVLGLFRDGEGVGGPPGGNFTGDAAMKFFFGIFDLDGSGEISFEEFKITMGALLLYRLSAEEDSNLPCPSSSPSSVSKRGEWGGNSMIGFGSESSCSFGKYSLSPATSMTINQSGIVAGETGGGCVEGEAGRSDNGEAVEGAEIAAVEDTGASLWRGAPADSGGSGGGDRQGTGGSLGALLTPITAPLVVAASSAVCGAPSLPQAMQRAAEAVAAVATATAVAAVAAVTAVAEGSSAESDSPAVQPAIHASAPHTSQSQSQSLAAPVPTSLNIGGDLYHSLEGLFSAIDSNKDGMLSFEEFKQWMDRDTAALLKLIDN